MSKRLVSLLLALLLIFGTCSVAFAASKSSGATGAKAYFTFCITKSYFNSIKIQRQKIGECYNGYYWEDYGKYTVRVYKVNSNGDPVLKKTVTVDFNDKSSVTLVSGWGTGSYQINVTPAEASADVYDDYYAQLGSYSWVTYPRYKITY